MPVPVEPTPVETESVQTARPVVAVLGEPGTRGALVKLLQDAGAEVIVTAVPDQLREADGMVVTGGASSLEAYEDLKAKDAERVIGRRVAGGRPVLVAGAALSCLFDSVTVEHPQMGQIQVQCMGSGPARVWSFLPATWRPVFLPCVLPPIVRCSRVLRVRLSSNLSTAFLSGLLIRALNILPRRR